MKKIITFLFFIQSFVLSSQNYKTNEYRIKADSGFIVINCCTENPKISFNPELEYTWFNDFSGIQTTRGDCGGKLLHGKRRHYSKDGKLIGLMEYNLGLKHGSVKTWNKHGSMEYFHTFNKGMPATLRKRVKGLWEEKRMIKKPSDPDDFIMELSYFNKDKQLENTITYCKEYARYKEYYPETGVLKAKITSKKGGFNIGKFVVFHPNREIQVIGNYSTEYPYGLKDGIWLWKNKFGKTETRKIYEIRTEKYDSGELKAVGSVMRINLPKFDSSKPYGVVNDEEWNKTESAIFMDEKKNAWAKDGTWHYFSKDQSISYKVEWSEGRKID